MDMLRSGESLYILLFPEVDFDGVIDIEGYCQGSGGYFLGCDRFVLFVC